MAHKPSALAPVMLGKALSTSAKVTTTLVVGTVLARLYTQPPGAPDRALAFNPNPHSNGRASPVVGATGAKGTVDPAMYAAIDSPQGATLEMLHHTVLKRYRHGGVLPRTALDNLRLVTLELTAPLPMISIDALQARGDITPANFSWPRTDYTDTQAVAQKLYTRYKSASGLLWHSARGPSVVAVFYESRIPASAFRLRTAPVPLMTTDIGDFVAEVLAFHKIVIGA